MQEMSLNSLFLARLAIVGFCLFIIILTSFHLIQPELSPLARFGSEYAVGRLGWLMNVAFLCFSVGLLSLAHTFRLGLKSERRSRTGEILLSLSAVGILGSGLFNADLQTADVTTAGILHAISGLLAFFTLIPSMLIFSQKLHNAGRLAGAYKALRYLPWISTLLFLAMLAYFGPNNLAGLGQRLFLASVFAWLITVAYGFQSGALQSLSKAPMP